MFFYLEPDASALLTFMEHALPSKVARSKQSVFSMRTDESSAKQYFQFYGYLSQQQNMLQVSCGGVKGGRSRLIVGPQPRSLNWNYRILFHYLEWRGKGSSIFLLFGGGGGRGVGGGGGTRGRLVLALLRKDTLRLWYEGRL